MQTFTESTVEDAALAWLEASGWQVAHGPDIVSEGIPPVVLCDMLLSKLISDDLRVKGAECIIGRVV